MEAVVAQARVGDPGQVGVSIGPPNGSGLPKPASSISTSRHWARPRGRGSVTLLVQSPTEVQRPADALKRRTRDRQPAAVELELGHRLASSSFRRADPLLVGLGDRLGRGARQGPLDREPVAVVKKTAMMPAVPGGSFSPSFSHPGPDLVVGELADQPARDAADHHRRQQRRCEQPHHQAGARAPSQTLAAQVVAMLDDRDFATGIVGDQDRPFDLDLLVLDHLHQHVEVSGGLVEVLIHSDEDVGWVSAISALSLRLRSPQMVLGQADLPAVPATPRRLAMTARSVPSGSTLVSASSIGRRLVVCPACVAGSAAGVRRRSGGRAAGRHHLALAVGALGGCGRRGVEMAGLDAVGPVQLEGPQLGLDAAHLVVGDRREVVGVADEAGHFGPVVVAEGAELAGDRHHGIHGIHPVCQKVINGAQPIPSGTPRPRSRSPSSQGGRLTSSSGLRAPMGSLSYIPTPPATAGGRPRPGRPAARGSRRTDGLPSGTRSLAPLAIPLRDHLASPGRPNHSARSIP